MVVSKDCCTMDPRFSRVRSRICLCIHHLKVKTLQDLLTMYMLHCPARLLRRRSASIRDDFMAGRCSC